VAAVNNDGDLPYDICEDDTMEKLLLDTMEEQGKRVLRAIIGCVQRFYFLLYSIAL